MTQASIDIRVVSERVDVIQTALKQAVLEAEAAAMGLTKNVKIWKRRGGATNAGDGWVIRSNGMCREPDEMQCPRPRYSDEGTQVWRQVLPSELVLR